MKRHRIILQLIRRLKTPLQILSALSLLLFFFFLREIATIPIENPDLSNPQLDYLFKLAVLSLIGFVGFAAFAIILDRTKPRIQANLSRAIQEHEHRCTPEQQRILILLGQGKTTVTIAAELGKTVREVSSELVEIYKIVHSQNN